MTDSTRPWASVVIPIKDERDNLTPLTERVLKVLSAREESNTAPFELIYIDDGSSDGSSELLDRLQQTYPAVRVLHFDRNYGQSSAFDAGFKHSTGDLVITLDGDLQNDPADIDKMLPLLRQFDLVCGWRTSRNDNLVRKLSSRIANAVRSAVTGDRVHDTGCSLKIFRRAVVDSCSSSPACTGSSRPWPSCTASPSPKFRSATIPARTAFPNTASATACSKACTT